MTLETGRIILYILGYFIIGVSLVPLIRNDNWVFRVFEYPRAQKLFINVVLLIVCLLIADWEDTHAVTFTILLTANALYLFYQIFPYTLLAKRQMMGQKRLSRTNISSFLFATSIRITAMPGNASSVSGKMIQT